jgi:excisionase family DNA binding protein
MDTPQNGAHAASKQDRRLKCLAEAALKDVVDHVAPKQDKLLNAAEAGSRLGLKPGTMYDLVQKGQIDHVKLFGKTLRFRESVILKIIADSEVKSTNSATVTHATQRNRKKANGASDASPSPSRRGRGSGSVCLRKNVLEELVDQEAASALSPN